MYNPELKNSNPNSNCELRSTHRSLRLCLHGRVALGVHLAGGNIRARPPARVHVREGVVGQCDIARAERALEKVESGDVVADVDHVPWE